MTNFSQQQQLARSRTTEAENKVSTLRNFPRTMDFDGLGLFFFIFGKWYYLHAEFEILKDTLIMESVILRSESLLHQWITDFHSQARLFSNFLVSKNSMFGSPYKTHVCFANKAEDDKKINRKN